MFFVRVVVAQLLVWAGEALLKTGIHVAGHGWYEVKIDVKGADHAEAEVQAGQHKDGL